MEASPTDIKAKAQGGRVKTYLKAAHKGANLALNPGGVALDYSIDKIGKSKVGSAVLDLTPLIGGYKQMREARDGQTTTGKKLEGKERLIHGAVGLGSLLLDATGAGEVEKGARIAGKSTGLMKSLGEGLAKRGATKSANLATKSAEFMAKNPELVRAAENVAEDHVDDAIKYVKSASKDDARNALKKEAGEYLPQSVANNVIDYGEAGMNARKAKFMAGRREQSPTRAANLIAPSPASGNDSANSLHARRASALASNRFQQGLRAAPPPLNMPPPLIRNIDDATARRLDMDQPEEDQQLEQNRITSTLLSAIAQRSATQQAQEQQDAQVNAAKEKVRLKIKQYAKTTFRRGAIFVVDLLAAALDLSSSGVSFVVDCILYMFTFGWLNLEMIYGKYFAKGKSRFVGPISWAPIPMPVDKDALILSGFIVAADIALAIAVLMVGMGGICLVHDFVKVTSSITEAAAIGASLAQGASGGLCLGGIISSTFGF